MEVGNARRVGRAVRGTSTLRGAQTVQRALDILFVFDAERHTLSTAEIAQQVRLTLPTTHRLLKALQSKDMVVFDRNSRRYSLGPQIIKLAGIIMQRDDLISLVEPWLLRLRESSGETASLQWRVGHQRICVREVVSPHPIRMVSGVGYLYPLTRGAAGKAILSALTRETAAGIVTEEGLSARERSALLAEVDEVRRRGYATSAGEVVSGAMAIAAPIVGAGDTVAAINVTGPQDRFTAKKASAVQKLVIEACAAVMRQLGTAGSAPARPRA